MTEHYKRIKEAQEKELWDKIQELQKDSQNRLAKLNSSLTGKALNRAQEIFANYEQLRKHFEKTNKTDSQFWKGKALQVAYSIIRLQIRWAKKVDQAFRVDNIQ